MGIADRYHRAMRLAGAAFAALLALSLLAITPHQARAAETWQLGEATQAMTHNCITQSDEVMSLNWAGYYGDPGVSPVVGQVYYVQAFWGVAGDPCPSGQATVHVEFTLPQATQLAISADNPVRCILENFNTGETSENTTDCPQAPEDGIKGGMAFDPPGSGWVTNQGYAWHILLPVITSQPLDGLETGNCPSCLKVALWEVDGNYNPWTYPQVGVPVVAGSAPPSASPSPSAAPSPPASPQPSPSTSPAPSGSPRPSPSGPPQPSSSPSSPPATSFPDVPANDPYYEAITQLVARGIIHGYQDGTFGPNDTTLRAQMAALIARAQGWDAESHPNPFTDQGVVDPDLWRNVGTLAFRNVARGYTDVPTCASASVAPPCYLPTDDVTNVQAISFITRAMVATGAWTQQPDDPAVYPIVPAASGHRADVATYVYYVGAIPGTASTGETWTVWEQPSTREWFAQALWLAIQ